MIATAQTVIEKLVKGGIRVTFELCSDHREWMCTLNLEGHECVSETGPDMPTSLLGALVSLGVALAMHRAQELEDP